MVRLLRTPAPLNGESFAGYLVRLASLNGHQSPNLIIEKCGWKINFKTHGGKHLIYPARNLTNLAELTGKSTNTLLSLDFPVNYSTNPNNKLSFNQLRDYFDFLNPKFCPLCLSDNDYHRTIWDLRILFACPFHQVRLVSICPECGKSLSWKRAYVSVCTCGFDLKSIKPDSVSPLEQAYSLFLYFSFNVFQDSLQMFNLSDTLLRNHLQSDPLCKLPLAPTLRFVEGLVNVLDLKYESRMLPFSVNFNDTSKPARVFSLFIDFPQHIRALFDWIFSPQLLQNSSFEIKFNSLLSHCDNNYLFFFLASLFEYLDNSHHYPRLAQVAAVQNDFVSLHRAATILNITSDALSKLFRSGFLTGVLINYEDFFNIYFKKTLIDKLKPELDEFFSFDDVDDYFQIPPSYVRPLRRNKIITRSKDALAFHFEWDVYNFEILEQLTASIRAKINPKLLQSDSMIMCADAVKEQIIFNSGRTQMFILEILEDRIKPFCEEKKSGLFRFSFLAEDIHKFVAKYPPRKPKTRC